MDLARQRRDLLQVLVLLRELGVRLEQLLELARRSLERLLLRLGTPGDRVVVMFERFGGLLIAVRLACLRE